MSLNEENKKNCEYCNQIVPADANRCPFCGSLLEECKPKNDSFTPITNYRRPLSNGLKVFLTVLFTVIPGFGQLAGIITSIIFMNTDDDQDRKSFGTALLVASIIMFVLSCIGCFILTLAFSINRTFNY